MITWTQRRLRAQEFEDLVQGSMTIEHYAAKNIEHLRFVAYLIPDEEMKAQRFQEGLLPQFRERVALLEIKDFSWLVSVAAIAEGELHIVVEYLRKQKSLQSL